MFKTSVFFYILEHPIAAYIILVTTGNAIESTMVSNDSTTKLWNIALEVN
jgi:hypothetical protein